MPTKVLIFDKNPQRKKVIEAALDSDAYLLAFARDGREGVAKFEAFKPDFLIANETLDDIAGLKVFRDLKKTGKITDSQFILMIREGEEEDLVQEKIFFLKKPFKTADIINLLEEVKMVKDNQSDFDLVEAEMDKVVQNLRKDNDEIMEDISSSSNPPVVNLNSDDIVNDALETSEELEIIDDLLEANDEELENLIDENENYSSEKLGVEPEKEKSKEEELDDLEKELYGKTEGKEESLPEEAGGEPVAEEEIPDDMLMDLEDIVEDETTEESVIEEEAVQEVFESVEIPEEEVITEEEPLAEPIENVIDETEASETSDDLISPEEITEEMLMENLNEEEEVADASVEIDAEANEEEIDLDKVSEMLDEEITEEDLINEEVFAEDNDDEVEFLESEELPEEEAESGSESESESIGIIDEANISDEDFQSAAEMGQEPKVEERSMDLDLDEDDELQTSEAASQVTTNQHGIDEALTFGEDLSEEDLAESDDPHHDLDESLFDAKVEEIKAEEAASQKSLDRVMHGMVEEIVRAEVEKSLKKALPELTASIEDYVKDIAPGIIKQVVTEEIEKLKEG